MAKKPEKDANTQSQTIDIVALERRELTVAVIGESPLILNKVSEKARRELLLPAPRKTAADKLARLKHQPLEEFRAAPYTLASDKEPTLLALPAGAFKKAIAQAAIDVPGAFKAQIGRLIWIEGVESELVGIFGVPMLVMNIVRSADMNRTPDVRTRVILKSWAALLRINYVSPNLTQKAIVNLLAAAGLIVGVGDWRQEKGAGSHGRFRLTDTDNPDFLLILRHGGREAQRKAMEDPQAYDRETEELLSWFDTELTRRRDRGDPAAPKKTGGQI